MFQGNWTCSTCGGAITELPFEPRGTSGLTCRDCYRKQKDGAASDTSVGSVASAPQPDAPESAEIASEMPTDDGAFADMGASAPAQPGERKMFTGEWKCSGCGGVISSLPFEPRDTSNLKCLDCFKKSKG